ncbi:hypothetical protein SUGI_0894350 [Cryptomeria japonica]|nr:hypothetical protein SUGI_0894350 [Cryptomeria japonica]
MAISRLVLGNWKEANEKTNGDVEDKPNQLKVCDMWQDIQGANHLNAMLDPINQLLKAEILRYGDFAQQCYDSFDNTPSSTYYGNCKRSKSSLAQRLELLNCGRGYQVTKYIYANTSLLDSIFGEESSEGVAWIGYNMLQHPNHFKSRCQDREGFLSCYTATDEDSVRCKLSARDTVVGEITRLVKEYIEQEEDLSITFTGHSLGAALATLSAYDIKQIMVNEYGVSSIPVKVFSFASPRVGNPSFAQHMEEIGVNVLRVVNHKDLVPKVPGIFFNEKLGWLTRLLHWLPWAYVHVGVEISIDSSRSAILKDMHNPANFHNLEVYLHALDGFQGNNKLPFKPSGRDPALVNKHSDLFD